jgi:hypothetical protein
MSMESIVKRQISNKIISYYARLGLFDEMCVDSHYVSNYVFLRRGKRGHYSNISQRHGKVIYRCGMQVEFGGDRMSLRFYKDPHAYDCFPQGGDFGYVRGSVVLSGIDHHLSQHLTARSAPVFCYNCSTKNFLSSNKIPYLYFNLLDDFFLENGYLKISFSNYFLPLFGFTTVDQEIAAPILLQHSLAAAPLAMFVLPFL